MSFKNTTLDIRTGDGIDDTLLEGLYYTANDGTQDCAPVGGTTDGLSVPRAVINIIPPYGGDWFSGVLHDSAYRDQLQKLDVETNQWIPASLPKPACDLLILEALASQGVSLIERETIYKAVSLFGDDSFNQDRGASLKADTSPK